VNDSLFVPKSQASNSAEAAKAAKKMFKNIIRLEKVITTPFLSDIRRLSLTENWKLFGNRNFRTTSA
jgi:hypothetical protein